MLLNTFIANNAAGASSGGGGQTQGSDADYNSVSNGITADLASSFTASSSYSISIVRVRLLKTGSPTVTIKAQVFTNGTGPGTQTGADSSTVLDTSTLTTSFANYDFTFTSPIAVTNATRYWIVLHPSLTGDASNYIRWAGNPSGTESQWGFISAVWTLAQASMDGTITTYPP